MISTIASLLSSGRGILAADESLSTIEKRFAAHNIPCSLENRRAYRELLITTHGLQEYISGVILFEETLHQSTGPETMPHALGHRGMVPGIKVDTGTRDLPSYAGEKITQGLDGLRERLMKYRDLGARFTKWRAVISIGPNRPSALCLEANALALALFASLSQEAGLVPIVEPEILMEGDHTLSRCEEVTRSVLQVVFNALHAHRVILEEMLLKTSLVLPGIHCPQQADDEAIAATTLRCFRRAIPAAVPGILILSGGQSEVVSTERLNAICSQDHLPWRLSFSFGRALQDSVLSTWKGLPSNRLQAQQALQHRARCNRFAVMGCYTHDLENEIPTDEPVICFAQG